jgi:site-specific DNA-methyltransferase (adenine-specific)
VKPYYERNGILIFCGDCREILPHVKADCVVTDPPYGMAYRHGSRGGNRSNGMDGHSIVGDDTPFDPAPLLALALPSILWGANHYADKLPPSRGWLIWDKRADGPQMDQSDAELAWCSFGSVARKFTRRWSGACLGGEEQRTGRVHVNQKPVDLLRWCLGFVPEGTILDPFMGSGTTLVAAKLEGRKAIGIEIEERYCEIAVKRLAQGVLNFGEPR